MEEKPPCHVCEKINGGNCPCDICLPELYPENEAAAMIYALVKNQVREHDGVKEVEGNFLLNTIALYEIENPQDCFERVLSASREMLNK